MLNPETGGYRPERGTAIRAGLSRPLATPEKSGSSNQPSNQIQPLQEVRISVLVTAFNPTRFFSDAIGSITAQTRTDVISEVVIATNNERAIDRSALAGLAEHAIPFRTISCDIPHVGKFFASAVSECHGNLICFLNDDDVWCPSKIAVVLAWFVRLPTLGYLQHRQSLIDQLGESVARYRLPSAVFTRRPDSDIILRPGQAVDWKRVIARTNPFFNDSSIAVRTDVLRRETEYLQQIPAMEDMFFFFAAVCSGLPIALLKDSLTMYRLHGQHAYTATPPEGAGSADPLRAVVERQLNALLVLDQMCRQSPTSIVPEYLARELTFRRLLLMMTERNVPPSRLVGELATYIRTSRFSNPNQDLGRLSVTGSLLLSRRLARFLGRLL
jgi:hypothetical protein